MDRCALFVDASYALGDGALAVHGTRNRDSVTWDYAGLLKLLGSMSRDRSGLPLLRCYWYDTSPDGNRTSEHDSVADIPGVKLRLAKIRPNRKEGVEAEIRKDLTALARNHAVSDVIIVSAEEDLAPVIAEVQDLGIRAILLTIATDGNWAASRALRQECDDLIEISPSHLRPYVDLISGAEPQLSAAGYSELTAGSSQSGEQHPAIEATEQRLYGIYQQAQQAQLAALSGRHDQRDAAHDPARMGVAGANGLGSYAAPGVGQRSAGIPGQEQPAPQYQRQGNGRELQAAGADQGFRPGGYPAGEPARGNVAQPPGGFAQHGLSDDGHVRGDSMPGGVPLGAPGSAQPGGPAHNGPAHNGLASAGPAAAGRDSGIAGQHDNGQVAGMQPGAFAANGPGTGVPDRGFGAGGMGPGAPSAELPGGFAGPSVPGMQAAGLPANGVARNANGLPGNGTQGSGYVAGQQLNSGPVGPLQGGSQPDQGAAGGLGQFGGLQPQAQPMPQAQPPQHVQPPQQAQPARQLGHGPAQGQYQTGPAPQQPVSHGQQGSGQLPGPGLPGSGLPGQQRHGSPPGGASGLAPPESQRTMLPDHQLPAGNGMHSNGMHGNGMPYAADGSAPYGGGQVQPAQFGAPLGVAYGRSPYGGQPGAPASGVSIGDAVQSAHAEGFGFGEAVARDAPALWLEAVLARKPRMPSDLEARLLQGSALPIDSLLHDEVRHALRRGFWDALERSRH